jgi:hypothetical protein
MGSTVVPRKDRGKFGEIIAWLEQYVGLVDAAERGE